MKMRLSEVRRFIRGRIIAESLTLDQSKLVEPDDMLVPALQEISRYGCGAQGVDTVAVGYISDSPFLTDEQFELITSIDTDPMGDPYEGDQWEYQIGWDENSQSYTCHNYTNMSNWGTSMPQPKSGNKVKFQTEEEVINWIEDMTHAAIEFAVSHEMVPKGEFGYADPGPEYTER